MGVLVFSLRKQFRAAGIPIACHHSHTQALWIYLIFGSKCQARFIPLGYFTNNLFLIRASPPQLVIKDPINGTEKGEAFKEWRQLFFSVRENPFVLLSRTLVLWLLFNSVFPLFLLQISKKKKKSTMNAGENGRNITVFQLSLGVINSKAEYKVIKRGDV